MNPVLLLVWALGATQTPPTTSGPDRELVSHVRSQFERIGRSAPRRDEALEASARTLAKLALTEGTEAAKDPMTITLAVSAACRSRRR